jgi:hypothetical protein
MFCIYNKYQFLCNECFVKTYSMLVFYFIVIYFCAQLTLCHKIDSHKRKPVFFTSVMGSKGSTYGGLFTIVVQQPFRP